MMKLQLTINVVFPIDIADYPKGYSKEDILFAEEKLMRIDVVSYLGRILYDINDDPLESELNILEVYDD